MRFQPEANQVVHVGESDYQVLPHPVVPQLPYGQEGRMATVYKLSSESKFYALKVYKDAYRDKGILQLSDMLRNYAVIPGLETCQRVVIDPQQNKKLVNKYVDLSYAVIMPWIEGLTWFDLLTAKEGFSRSQGARLARELSRILVSMEERSVAHCDLSAPNVLVSNVEENPRVSLVDVEQLFGPTLTRPHMLLVGTPGYVVDFQSNGRWSRFADRFAGAILLAEMLTWHDQALRDASWGDSYFDPGELQQETDRYQLMRETLSSSEGEFVAELFSRVWEADSFETCPSLWEWNRVLSGDTDTISMRLTKKVSPVVLKLKAFETRARDYMLDGKLELAIEQYEHAQDFAIENDAPFDPYLERINELSIQRVASYWVDDELSERAFEIVNLKEYDAADDSGKKLGGFTGSQLFFFLLLLSGISFYLFSSLRQEILRGDFYDTLALQIGLTSFLFAALRRSIVVPVLYILVSIPVSTVFLGLSNVDTQEMFGLIFLSGIVLEIFIRIYLFLKVDPIRQLLRDFLYISLTGLVVGGIVELGIDSPRISPDEPENLLYNFGLSAAGWLIGKIFANLIISVRERTG